MHIDLIDGGVAFIRPDAVDAVWDVVLHDGRWATCMVLRTGQEFMMLSSSRAVASLGMLYVAEDGGPGSGAIDGESEARRVAAMPSSEKQL